MLGHPSDVEPPRFHAASHANDTATLRKPSATIAESAWRATDAAGVVEERTVLDLRLRNGVAPGRALPAQAFEKSPASAAGSTVAAPIRRIEAPTDVGPEDRSLNNKPRSPLVPSPVDDADAVLAETADPTVKSWAAFDGATSGWQPANPSISVGPSHVVAAANAMFEVYDKQGRVAVAGPPAQLDTWFDPLLSELGIDFDVAVPKLVYDPVARRFILAARADNLARKLSMLVFSISANADPTGRWCSYLIGPTLTGQEILPLMVADYSLGVNKDSLYFTTGLYEVVNNQTGTSTKFDHSRAFVLAKSAYFPSSGCASTDDQTWTRLSGITDANGNLAEDIMAAPNLDGTSDLYIAATDPDGGSAITLWHGQTRSGSPAIQGGLSRTTINVDAYKLPPNADQKGTTEKVFTGSAALTSAVQRRGNLWLAHARSCTLANRTTSCFQWYAVDPLRASVIEQDGRGPTDGAFYFPAIVPDGRGQPVAVYNRSGKTEFVSAGFGDGGDNGYLFATGTPGRGNACYDDERGRDYSAWGFVNAAALDPVNGSVWGHVSYAAGTSTTKCASNDWRTVVFEVANAGGSDLGGISGRVYFKGQPEPDAELELREVDGPSESSVAKVTTDGDGNYVFAGVPELPSGHIYYVRYANPLLDSASNVDNDRLAIWLSRSITTYRAGEPADGGSFDIADIELVSPAAGAVVPYGTTFRWALRSQAFEHDQDEFCLRFTEWDPQRTLGRSKTCTTGDGLPTNRADLPAEIVSARRYGWSVQVCHDPSCDTMGVSLWRRAVTFEDAVPTNTPTPTPTPMPASPPWTVGLPILASHDFRGTYLGRGRFADRPGPVSNRADSGVQLQNLDGNAVLNAGASFLEQRDPYEADRSAPPPRHEVQVKGVPAGGSSNFYLPSLNLPHGLLSLAIQSDGGVPSAAIARTDWSTGGAAIYSNVAMAARLVVPLVVRNYYGQTSIISVMAGANGGSKARARIDFFASGDPRPLPGPSFDLAPGEALLVDLADDQPGFNRLGKGFLGSAAISVDGEGVVGAASLVYMETSQLAVSAFEAVPVEEASNSLLVPLFRSRQAGVRQGDRLDTGISVVNPMDRAIDVTVTYYPSDSRAASEACRSQRAYRHGPISVSANSSYVFYQGPGGGHGLPDGCFGSAVVQTSRLTDEILAVVNDATNLGELTAAYSAVPAEKAATKVALPLFRNRHLAQEYTTGIQVMNASDRLATVEIVFTTSEGATIAGCGADCVATIEPNRAYTWYPPIMASIPAGVYGSAVIRSDQPVVAIVNDYPLKATGVDAAIYNGIPVPERPLAR